MLYFNFEYAKILSMHKTNLGNINDIEINDSTSVEEIKSIMVGLILRNETAGKNSINDIREQISGPIIEALFLDQGVISKRLNSGLIIEFIYQSKITRDFILSTPANPDHIWEPFTTRLLLDLCAGVKNVIVGGAYLGDHALLIAHKMRENKGKCHAFEPNSISFDLLENNAKINQLDNLFTVKKGLWNEKEIKMQLIGEDAYTRTEVLEDGESVGEEQIIATTTINDYVNENSLDNVGLIMLDIEGAEYDALIGASDLLKSENKPIVVFEVHSDYVDWSDGLEKTDIVKYLSSFGYSTYAIRDFHTNKDVTGLPIELIPSNNVYLEGPPHGFNMIAVLNDQLICNDLYRIVENVSPKLLMHKDPKIHWPSGWIKNNKGSN
ncbi:MAG: FkbM family methyltransferase [Bacteroidetes bacterium]|nr:FkbM family methyltransferase [Bacteroidota bacterium]